MRKASRNHSCSRIMCVCVCILVVVEAVGIRTIISVRKQKKNDQIIPLTLCFMGCIPFIFGSLFCNSSFGYHTSPFWIQSTGASTLFDGFFKTIFISIQL